MHSQSFIMELMQRTMLNATTTSALLSYIPSPPPYLPLGTTGAQRAGNPREWQQ